MKQGYRQCCLVRESGGVSSEQVSYIPEQFAKKGEFVKLKDNGVWSDGWLVSSVGAFSDHPPDWRKAIRGHRKETGDSLPK
jgi:hypothetical protein